MKQKFKILSLSLAAVCIGTMSLASISWAAENQAAKQSVSTPWAAGGQATKQSVSTPHAATQPKEDLMPETITINQQHYKKVSYPPGCCGPRGCCQIPAG